MDICLDRGAKCVYNDLHKTRKRAEGNRVSRMREYEMVREIPNLCPNNQMRDIFFDEVETDDPESYVRKLLKGRAEEVAVSQGAGGAVTVYAQCDGMKQKFVFTPL